MEQLIIISYAFLFLLFLKILKVISSVKKCIFTSFGKENSKEIKLPKINLVVVCRNEEKRLNYLLASDLSFFNEIILIDDNSTDQTLSIMKNYKKISPYKIHIFKNPRLFEGKIINSKAGALEFFREKYSSNCEYVFFCDADISFLPNRYFFQKIQFRKNVVYTFLPKYKVTYWWEKVWLPLFLTLCFLEYRFYISKTQMPILGFAWIIHKKILKYAFTPLDIKASITEDYVISRNLLQNGVQIKMIDGSSFLSIKCYENMKHFLHTSKKGYLQLSYFQRFFIFLLALTFNLIIILNFILLIHSLLNLKPILLFLSSLFYLIFIYILYQPAKWIEMKKSWLLVGFLSILLYLAISLNFLLSRKAIWRGKEIRV